LWEEFNNIDVRDYQALHPELFAYVKEAMAAPDKQYLLIGDTAHTNSELGKFFGSPGLAALCKYAGIPHVAIEMRREILEQGRLDSHRREMNALSPQALEARETGLLKDLVANIQNWAGRYELEYYSKDLRLSESCIGDIRKQVEKGRRRPADAQKVLEEWDKVLEEWDNDKIESYRADWGVRLFGFMRAGLRVTPADSWQWWPFIVPGYAERFFLGDPEVAAYIALKAQNDKTAVTYGAGHLWHKGGLGDNLGRGKCVQIDIHPSRASYEENLKNYGCYVDRMPDRIYLLKEGILEAPDPALYRAPENPADELKEWERQIAQTYGPDADQSVKEAALSKIVKLPGVDPQYFNYVP
jgi:hypothetical protein